VDWKAHLLVGCIFGAIGGHAALSLSGVPLAAFCAISGFCALLPDLDLRKSKSSQILYAAAALFALAAAYFLSGFGKTPAWQDFALCFAAAAILLAAADLFFRPSHRKIMHSLSFLAICTAFAWLFLGQFFSLAFFFGYFSHLLADMCIKP
jgi:membrane-bound metal-dependent hydrolase YbcI (DUF457 family)